MGERSRTWCAFWLLAAVGTACGTGTSSSPDAGSGPSIERLEATPVPLEGELEVSWSSPDTSSCDLAVTGAASGPFVGEAPEGTRTVPVDFLAVEHRPVVTLQCGGEGGSVEERLEVPVPYIASFTANPSSVSADGGDVVLCWELAQGEEPVCAIRADPGGEYYYPLLAADCLFPLRVDVTNDFLLYCSPQNGYVERSLTVPVGAQDE